MSATKNTSDDPKALTKGTRTMRFYQKDYEEMQEWEHQLNASTGLTVVKMLRDSVAAGWPIVQARLKAAAKEI